MVTEGRVCAADRRRAANSEGKGGSCSNLRAGRVPGADAEGPRKRGRPLVQPDPDQKPKTRHARPKLLPRGRGWARSINSEGSRAGRGSPHGGASSLTSRPGRPERGTSCRVAGPCTTSFKEGWLTSTHHPRSTRMEKFRGHPTAHYVLMGGAAAVEVKGPDTGAASVPGIVRGGRGSGGACTGSAPGTHGR